MNDYPHSAELGYVTSAGKVVTVNGTAQRQAELYLPPGFSSIPVPGQRVVVFECGTGAVCGGAQSDTEGLLPGEVKITSSGNGYIYLNQNGDVEINGIRITRDGKFLVQGDDGIWIQK